MRIIIVAVIVIVALVVVLQTLYTVDETQMAIVTRFGEFKRAHTSPGLYVKTPFVDTVLFFDRRLLRYDAPPSALLTKDKKTLVIDAYARYKIVDPLQFFKSVGDETRAGSRVGEIVASELREEIARDNQSDIIRETRADIMVKVTAASAAKAEELNFGIEIVDVRLKRADFTADIAQSVYARMQAERNRIAKGFRAEGAEDSAKISAEADKERTIILAEAERKSAEIRGQGEAEAIKIFAEALEQDPEFYAFQRSLEAYKNFMATQTTVVLSADSDLFKYLQAPGGGEEAPPPQK